MEAKLNNKQNIIIIVNKEDANKTESISEYIKDKYKISAHIQESLDAISTDTSTLHLLYLSDGGTKKFISKNIDAKLNIAILPNEHNKDAIKSFGISSNINEAIDDALDMQRYTTVDLLTCNDEPVFHDVTLGDVHGLSDTIEKQTKLLRFKSFLKNLQNLKLQDFTFTTEKEYELNTAAAGVMILEHNIIQHSEDVLDEKFYINDGKLNAFILAPKSILSYVYYLIMIFFYAHFKLKTLPKSIGLIKTAKLNITSKDAINFKIDKSYLSAKNIELEVHSESLTIALGRNIENLNESKKPHYEDKEIIKTKDLPAGEVKQMLLKEKIPFFKKAEESDFKELFVSLRESANLSSVFIVLMVLSTLLATTGLFQNSAPVIIGAMILAPLMAPIISLSMGVVRSENHLIKTSIRTLFYGIFTALLFSVVLTYFMPLTIVTDEMRGRLNPNLLDLMVAVLSGIAGAYANSKSEIAKSLAGVAIAVALVPPLSVMGIGLGWADMNMVFGAFLLFITNLVGITISAALTFLVLGYSAVHRAKKGVFYTFIILAIITVPLVLSFNKALEQNNIYELVQNKTFSINNKNITLDISYIDLSTALPTLHINTYSLDVLEKKDLLELKDRLQQKLRRDVKLSIVANTRIN